MPSPFLIGRFEEEASFFPPIGVEAYVEVKNGGYYRNAFSLS